MIVNMLGCLLMCSAGVAQAQFVVPAPGTISNGGAMVAPAPVWPDPMIDADTSTPTIRRQWISRVALVSAVYPDILERIRAIDDRRERVAYFLELEREARSRRESVQH